MSARIHTRALAVIALLFCAAPTAGDIGGCGRDATLLSEPTYARTRKTIDCDRCRECGYATQRCARACDPKAPNDIGFPSTCYPLLHDGEVCVRALRAASCDDYGGYVDDAAPTVPTECDFCRVAPDGSVP